MTVVRELIGVYDADGTIIGELSYFLRARVGRAHCALCDITHGAVRERTEWQARRADLGVPFTTYHRNDQPDEVRLLSGGLAPVVVARADTGLVVLLDHAALERCDGSPRRLVDELTRALAEQDLSLP